MTVYVLTDPKSTPPSVIIEAKSETAARLHLTRNASCKPINAKEIAALVLAGVRVEKAGRDSEAEAEAVEVALRG